MSVADVTSLHGSEARLASRISDFRAVASDDVARGYDRDVDPALARQNTLLGQAIEQSGGMTGQVMPGMAIDVPVGTWHAANHAVTTGLDKVTNSLAGSLLTGAESMRSGASGAAATAIVVLLIALAATIALVVLIARQLLGSIGILRRTARDVATRHLPDAVERIRAGDTVDATVAPVNVHTADEVGQLARAFDAVHGEALRLAVEQANMRANYSELFVNLSRRSQSLVRRQLRLIEQLERDEEDPEQLSALFKLDHLATRMRRNNENLMVLSGGELARSGSQQVSLADLLRAAVSEIEHYQRVVVQPPPDAYVVGYAAGDLVRLVAELLDNATAFSSPDTQVTVASHRTRRRAVVIDIVDHGIGMSDEDLLRANEQLSHPAGVEGRISRRMGLFVISRLAHQHDVRVRLHGGQDIPGLRVTITVPDDLVIGEPEPLPPTPRPDDGPGDGGGTNGFGGLPKRTAGATTAPNGAWHGALRGTLEQAPSAVADPVADPIATAMTVTIPVLPSAESSGVRLFEPLSEEDEAETEPVPGGGEAAGAAGSELEPEPTPEVTPIYDTMVSAWFEDTPAAEPEQVRRTSVDDWRFAADEGWQAVGAVADVEPSEFTTAGLPKRQPKALLLPGSVRQEQGPAAGQPVTAERVRHRLSGFQDGMRRARQEPAERTVVAEPVAQPPVTETESARDWTSSADEGWRAVDAMPETGEVTAVGLPRRRPRAHLLPGSVMNNSTGNTAPQQRDAGAMRERLSSFQRGVREGRGGTAPAAQTPVEHGFHW
jgi:signal transduction histidine kinase